MSKSQVYTELKFVYACNNACHESLLSESGFSTKHSHGCMHACMHAFYGHPMICCRKMWIYLEV